MASYVTKEFQLRFQRPYHNDLINRLKRRDLRILVIAVGALVEHPLLAIGSLTHLAVFQILVSGRHTTLSLHASHMPIEPIPSITTVQIEKKKTKNFNHEIISFQF